MTTLTAQSKEDLARRLRELQDWMRANGRRQVAKAREVSTEMDRIRAQLAAYGLRPDIPNFMYDPVGFARYLETI